MHPSGAVFILVLACLVPCIATSFSYYLFRACLGKHFETLLPQNEFLKSEFLNIFTIFIYVWILHV